MVVAYVDVVFAIPSRHVERALHDAGELGSLSASPVLYEKRGYALE